MGAGGDAADPQAGVCTQVDFVRFSNVALADDKGETLEIVPTIRWRRSNCMSRQLPAAGAGPKPGRERAGCAVSPPA